MNVGSGRGLRERRRATRRPESVEDEKRSPATRPGLAQSDAKDRKFLPRIFRENRAPVGENRGWIVRGGP